MTTGLLFVLHGRKEKIAPDNLTTIARLQKLTDLPSTYGFLEGSHATLESGAERLVAQGVTHILALPLLLFPATHALEDLPTRLTDCLPSTGTYEVEATLATTKAIYHGLVEKIKQAPAGQVLVVAHGTPHYEKPLIMLKVICHQLAVDCQRPILWGNYVGPENYLEVAKKITGPLVVVPFFLTEGHIVKAITQKITATHRDEVTFLPTFQESDTLYLALREKMEELGCIPSYSTSASEKSF